MNSIYWKLTSWFGSRPKYPKSPRLTYSYECEDLFLEKILMRDDGFFVDIGAHDPVKHSNTYLLHKRGWIGVNVDANPLVIKKFNLSRKEDVNLNIGVSDMRGHLQFYISENPLLSSFDKEGVVNAKERWGFSFREISVDVVTLASIMEEHANVGVDLLNIDVEGLELEVLKGGDWERFKPKVVVVELHERYVEDVLKSELYEFLCAKGYRLVVKTLITLIFEDIS